MKLSVLQQDLLPSLQATARSTGARSSLPVLDNVLISAERSALKIAATNLEVGIIKRISAQIEEEGELTVPAKTIVEIISGIGPNKLELETRGSIMTVSSGKFRAEINGIPAVEFPAIPLSEGEGVFFEKEALIPCSQILFSAATDEGRPILTSILTHTAHGKLDFVATDGFRLAHRQVKLAGDPKQVEGFKCLIPKRTFEEVLRVIAEEDAEKINAAPSAGQNQIVFTVGQTIISSRLIEGQFPSWEKIIPANIITRAIVDKDQIIKAIKLAAVFAKTQNGIIVLKIAGGKILFESSAKELGSQQNEIDGQIEGEDLQVAFNAKFLQDAVAQTPSTQLIMEFSGALSAALVKPVGVEGLEYIIMPVRLS